MQPSIAEEGIPEDWTAECNNLRVDGVPKSATKLVKPQHPHHLHQGDNVSASVLILQLLQPFLQTPMILLLITYLGGLASGLLMLKARSNPPSPPLAKKNN